MSPTNHDNPTPQPVDRDLLISRVVDDAASAEDWAQLRALAEYDPSVWRELFEAQHTQAELAQAVEQAIAIADGVEAPTDHLPGVSLRFRARQTASWAGWALAAGVAIAWIAPQLMPPPAATPGPARTTEVAQGGRTPSAGEQADPRQSGQPREFELIDPAPGGSTSLLARTGTTEEDAPTGPYRSVATTGAQQLAEMPDRVLLEVRPLDDGRLELIYVRRLIEKAIVDDGDLYQVKPDDAGIDRTVPYRTRRPSSGPI